MSNELQHRLYNYEVAPPEATWEKIAKDLDDSHLNDRFPNILRNSAVTAPATAWTSISSTLDELNIGNKFPSTLYNLETAPPATAWDNIQNALNEEPAAAPGRNRRVVPMFVRYAAAAIFILAISVGAVRILTASDADDQVVNNDLSTIKENNVPAAAPNENNTNTESIAKESTVSDNETTLTQDQRDDAALEQSRQTYASLDASDRQRMKKVHASLFQTDMDPIEVAANFNPAHTYEELECSDVSTPVFTSGSGSIDMAARYAMLMTPDGNFIRISKKLGDLVCCVSGEEQDDECTDQLKKWRKKIANAPVAPSPGNFMDILDMLHALKDGSL